MEFERTKELFDKYVDRFDKNTYGLEKKYSHSYRVVKYAEQIAESIKLNNHDFYLAQVIALFHDISRFKQGKEYGTFNDLISFDHGDVAEKILIAEGLIDEIVDDEEDKNIVLKAVKNHNKYQIEDGLTDKELLQAKLVRDADKIDILNSQINSINDKSYKVSNDVYEYLKNRKLFKRDDNIVYDDYTRICMQISFIFDLNFKRSFEIIEENGMLKKKFNLIRNEEIEKIINTFINEKMRMF